MAANFQTRFIKFVECNTLNFKSLTWFTVLMNFQPCNLKVLRLPVFTYKSQLSKKPNSIITIIFMQMFASFTSQRDL